VLVRMYLSCLVFSILYLCVFVLSYGSLAINEDIVKSGCRGKTYTLFAYNFVKILEKIFQFLYSFSWFSGLFVPF